MKLGGVERGSIHTKRLIGMNPVLRQYSHTLGWNQDRIAVAGLSAEPLTQLPEDRVHPAFRSQVKCGGSDFCMGWRRRDLPAQVQAEKLVAKADSKPGNSVGEHRV